MNRWGDFRIRGFVGTCPSRNPDRAARARVTFPESRRDRDFAPRPDQAARSGFRDTSGRAARRDTFRTIPRSPRSRHAIGTSGQFGQRNGAAFAEIIIRNGVGRKVDSTPDVIGWRLFGGLRHCFCSVGFAIWNLFQIPSVAV